MEGDDFHTMREKVEQTKSLNYKSNHMIANACNKYVNGLTNI